jgi:uncharacterized DUF497 family protein
MADITFEWDERKDAVNQRKHNVSFTLAQNAFFDKKRLIAKDIRHCGPEERYFCIGRVDDGILTVRFTYRGDTIRIIGAGYWRKGKLLYEEKNRIYG